MLHVRNFLSRSLKITEIEFHVAGLELLTLTP